METRDIQGARKTYCANLRQASFTKAEIPVVELYFPFPMLGSALAFDRLVTSLQGVNITYVAAGEAPLVRVPDVLTQKLHDTSPELKRPTPLLWINWAGSTPGARELLGH